SLSPRASRTTPVTNDPAAQPHAIYTSVVRATDAPDNTGPRSRSSYTFDTTPPPTPVITSSPTTPDNKHLISWGFTAEAGATTECSLVGGTLAGAFADCSSPVTYDLTGQADGDYVFSVRATDQAGNTGSATTNTYLLDTTRPDVTITSPPASPDNDRSPTWSFTTEAGATTECRLDGPSGVVSAFSACASPKSYSLAGQPDGGYTFTV